MSAKLIAVRHAETVGNSSVRYYGRTDLRLSELGRQQMRAAARALSDHRFAMVFASNLRRAIEGARLVAGGGGEIVEIDEFSEIDFGMFEGLSADEIAERHPEEFKRWRTARLDEDYAYPRGESRTEFNTRVERGLARMLDLWRRRCGAIEGSALLVAHRGVIRAIVRKLGGAEAAAELGSIQVLERVADNWEIRGLDLIEHLRGVGG